MGVLEVVNREQGIEGWQVRLMLHACSLTLQKLKLGALSDQLQLNVQASLSQHAKLDRHR